ncbi:hypothetical protein HDU90_000987 [Geranomyces variabilis]|nr:hypothetical protein HDU90_000987 [Geranomyces variabilis]
MSERTGSAYVNRLYNSRNAALKDLARERRDLGRSLRKPAEKKLHNASHAKQQSGLVVYEGIEGIYAHDFERAVDKLRKDAISARERISARAITEIRRTTRQVSAAGLTAIVEVDSQAGADVSGIAGRQRNRVQDSAEADRREANVAKKIARQDYNEDGDGAEADKREADVDEEVAREDDNENGDVNEHANSIKKLEGLAVVTTTDLGKDYVKQIKSFASSTCAVVRQHARHLTILAERWCTLVLDRGIHAVLAAMPGLTTQREALILALGTETIRLSRSWLAWPLFQPNEFALNADVVVSVLTALAVDETTAVLKRVEATSKCLISQIIGNTIALSAPTLQVRHGFAHEFSAMGSSGSGRSDMAIAVSSRREAVAILLCEFAPGRDPVHKDFEVAPAEAAFESKKILRYCALEEIADATIHIALIAGTLAEFSVLTPITTPEGVMLWALDKRGPTFDLGIGSLAGRVEQGLRLAAYLIDAVVPAGLRVRKILDERTTIQASIPLPSVKLTAPKSRKCTAPFTPYKKRA